MHAATTPRPAVTTIAARLALAAAAALAAPGCAPTEGAEDDQSVEDVLAQASLTTRAPASATNGWGPYETNRSNGERAAGDGRTITLNGRTYTRGLGVHAHSELRYALGGTCTNFVSDVGVDDEVGARGSVTFEVWADGVRLFNSGRMTGNTATQRVNVSLSGRRELRLVVTDAGDGRDYDHADWADPRITCDTGAGAGAGPGVLPGTRSKYTWPFAQNSIWNMPIGSGARYVPAGIQPANAWYGRITVDPEQISVDSADPLRPLTGDDGAVRGEPVRVRPSLHHDGGWNGCATFLRQDGNTVWQGQPLRLAAGGSPAWRWTYPRMPVDLRGDGILGCHGGAHMSGIGGSIRLGELNGPDPIRHVLKVNLYGRRFLYNDVGGTGYRWPAVSADSYWRGNYGGRVPALRMGALLAVRPDADLSFITSAKARKIAEALRDYGAYVVDDTAWDVHAIDMDERLVQTGEWPTTDAAFHSQLQRVFTMLHVVDNNSPTSIGGGGTPRAPLAPPFRD